MNQNDYIIPRSHQELNCLFSALSSANIPSEIITYHNRAVISFQKDYREQVYHEFAEYFYINHNWPRTIPSFAPPHYLRKPAVSASLITILGMTIFFIITGNYDSTVPLFQHGCANSIALHNGEWWRCVTSLCLHSNWAHLLGNAVCLGIFGYHISKEVGYGVSWLGILLSGIFGNFLASWFTTTSITSLGASTSAFSALGILCCLQTIRQIIESPKRCSFLNKIWIPIFAGITILSLLGTGENSDVSAHFYGFICGLIITPFIYPFRRNTISHTGQFFLFILAVTIIKISWFIAINS